MQDALLGLANRYLHLRVSNVKFGTGKQHLMSAEILGSLSHALDLTEGQPPGHCVRCCCIGVNIAGHRSAGATIFATSITRCCSRILAAAAMRRASANSIWPMT